MLTLEELEMKEKIETRRNIIFSFSITIIGILLIISFILFATGCISSTDLIGIFTGLISLFMGLLIGACISYPNISNWYKLGLFILFLISIACLVYMHSTGFTWFH